MAINGIRTQGNGMPDKTNQSSMGLERAQISVFL